MNLQVQLDYALTSADTGAVMLVVQSADNRNLGKATLAVDFVVPQTSAVKVFTPLSEQGQSSTATVALRTYKVMEK